MSNEFKSQSVEISSLASAKMMGHALRFPYGPIHGILLGKFQEGSSTILIQDIIPVCHSYPTKPIIDMALRMTEVHLDVSKEELKDLKIVGWYAANERSDDETPKHAALKITSELSEYSVTNQGLGEKGGEIILISVLSKGMKQMMVAAAESKDESPAFKVYGRDGVRKDWTREYPPTQISVQRNSRLASIFISIASKDAKASTLEFFDFESHLEEGGLNNNWITNAPFTKLVQ